MSPARVSRSSSSTSPRGTVKQEFSPDADPLDDAEPGSSFAGIRYAPDGSRLYAADAGGAIAVADVAADGTLTLNKRVALPPANGAATARPGGLALTDDGSTLLVALNMNNTLGVIDLTSGQLTDEIPVGNAPFTVAVAGRKAYVSNQGGRPADAVDLTNDSGGTRIVVRSVDRRRGDGDRLGRRPRRRGGGGDDPGRAPPDRAAARTSSTSSSPTRTATASR